jgi:multiple antibiotic resistance protein
MLSMDDYVQAIIAVFVITDPIGKSIFFLLLTKDAPQKRVQSAITVCVTVAIILGGASVIGRQLLDAMGIHLGAFGFTGGLIVAGMGLEMLGTGHTSRAQGDRRDEPHTPPDEDDSLFVPFAMPLIAGPGAITVVITLASKVNSWEATWMALIAVGVNVLIMAASFIFLAGYLSKLSDRAIGIFTRFGGLVVATIGVQLAFNGIKSFFELGVSP